MTPSTPIPNSTPSNVFDISTERYLRHAGDLFVYEGDHESALLMIEKTLELNPTELRALTLKGDILYCLNRDLEALDAFNDILREQPGCVQALASKAAVLDSLGNLRQSLKTCEKAISLLNPNHHLVSCLFEQKLSLLYRLKRFREAGQTLKQAEHALSPQDISTLKQDYKGQIEFHCQKRQAKSSALSRLQLVKPLQATRKI